MTPGGLEFSTTFSRCFPKLPFTKGPGISRGFTKGYQKLREPFTKGSKKSRGFWPFTKGSPKSLEVLEVFRPFTKGSVVSHTFDGISHGSKPHFTDDIVCFCVNNGGYHLFGVQFMAIFVLISRELGLVQYASPQILVYLS